LPFVSIVTSTSLSHLIVYYFSIKNLSWYYIREKTKSKAGYRANAKIYIRKIAWYYARKKARDGDNAGDNTGDRGRGRTKVKHMISISELVYLHTESIIDLMLLFLPLLLRFCISTTGNDGDSIPNPLHDVRRNSQRRNAK